VRRVLRLVLGAIVVAALLVGNNAQAADLPPLPDPGNLPQSLCQPDPTVMTMQTLSCRYGPLAVTPGSNLILFGPVTIESPRADGFITRFEPNLIDAVTGQVPPIHQIHLHHGVWLNATKYGLTPFFATGEEKTISTLPRGYGLPTSPTDAWVLNYMLHNLTSQTYSVYITYRLNWIAKSSAIGSTMKAVEPIWMDIIGGAYPVYNPTRQADGTHERSKTFVMPKDYEIVEMAGHVHPGGLRDEIRADCGGPAGHSLVFTSQAKLNRRKGGVPDPRAFGSWDYMMTATRSNSRPVVKAGDRLKVTAVYDTSHPWYEAMGIVLAFGHPLASGEKASVPYCAKPAATTGDVTNKPAANPVFGGDHAIVPNPSSQTAAGSAVTNITIASFDYQPGGLGQAPAAVKPGSVVRFDNMDASASIFHTVTTCAPPCNKDYGQSYPLAEWGFDSRQLGYGPPGVTAAANTTTYDLTIPANAPAGETITFFCRIHPFMRGALKVGAGDGSLRAPLARPRWLASAPTRWFL
jgi:hypothetical protein